MAATRHCQKCGREWTLNVNPGRSENCHGCGADLRICLNCQFYDRGVAHQCRERRAEPVDDKTLGNFCEYFEFVRREWQGNDGEKSREDAARDALKKLLGD